MTTLPRKPCPPFLDGAQVILHSFLGAQHRKTGRTSHFINGEEMAAPSGLAIAEYLGGEGGYYLFYCDASWVIMNDTFHDTLADARAQAEREFEGVSATWTEVLGN